jgi:hypothetical protein
MTSLLPLMSSLSVQARGAFMAATLAMFSLGDSVGTLLGPLLFQGDILRNALGAIMFNFIGIFLLKVFVKPVEISQEKVTALEVL